MGHARRFAHAQHGWGARRRRMDDRDGAQFRHRGDVLLCPAYRQRDQLNGNGRSMQWSSDLIGYDALTSYGSPSYYAQQMFSTMHGDEILATDSQDIPTREWQPRAQRGSGTAPTRQLRQVFFNATRDSRSRIVYLKVVNEAG